MTVGIRLSIEEVRAEIQATGCILVSDIYRNNRTPLTVLCPRGHSWTPTYDNFRAGKRCPSCQAVQTGERRRTGIEAVRQALGAAGYQLISSQYRNNRQALEMVCPQGHSLKLSYSNFHQGRRCQSCSVLGAPKVPADTVGADFSLEGYRIVSGLDQYQNVRTKLLVQCPAGHEPYAVQVYNFRTGGRRCPGCACGSASGGEKQILEYVRAIGFEAGPNRTALGNRQEIDIYVPALKVGIEYNGLYWHSEAARPDKLYHVNKLEAATSQGIRLLQFFADEWSTRRPEVESIIRQALGVPAETKYQARKCSLRALTLQERKVFFEKAHLQGDCRASIAWGLFAGPELVQCLSLRQVRYTGNNGGWEIARTASAARTLVVGGLSRLVAQARSWLIAKGVQELTTFADRRYSLGQSYLKVGFEAVGKSQPGYWYTDFTSRYHRFGLRKTSDCPAGMTEVQWRKSQGLHRIFDCGQLRFRLQLRP